MITQPPSNEAVEAAMKACRYDWDDQCGMLPITEGDYVAYADYATLAAEVERLRARVAELEELIGLASTSFSMLEAYLGPQWFEAVSNMELVGPDKVHASAALAKKEGER